VSGSFSAGLNLLVSNLDLSSTINQVSICDLFYIRSPSVRKDSIFGNLAATEVLGEAKLAIVDVLK
jgi:hypothetical protein